MKVVYGEAERA